MSKRTLTIALLAAALLATNAWWLYRTIDFGITHTYRMAACEMDARALAQLKAILPVVARPNSTRAEVLAAARVDPREKPYEKDGAVWVGQLGLRFSSEGRFVEMVDTSR